MKFQRMPLNPNTIILQDCDAYPYDIDSMASKARKSWFGALKHRLASLVSLDAVWQRLATFAVGSSEPVVMQRCDRQGHRYYVVYDPRTQSRTICSSETEVRAWLESRYYHP